MVKSVSVKELVDNTHLKVFSGEEYLDRPITTSDISRPGLELTGYFDYYPSERIQLLGITETSFAKHLPEEKLKDYMNRMCQPDTPAFVISTDLEPPQELIDATKKAHIPILESKLNTSRVLSNMTDFLEAKLAPRKSVHGVLVEVYGLGVLITGESGIGKSETALELVKRGHRLIADDRVEVYQRDEQALIGQAPKILSHLLEIRGIGIIDVMTLFGAGAVRSETKVDLVVHLDIWNKDTKYDRLGNNHDTVQFFDVELKELNIPVKPGRNLAIIIETAAMNFRANSMGYNATDVFNKELNGLIKKNEKNDGQNQNDKSKDDNNEVK
ncbi:HPr kinase/phosphorylase [Fructilactobacillus lindneri]|uniref:HPr kinase/phosphorylase n=2 Tax=Fructilactobacillus lindneri TaxID=53444 RepID=A0A0R2JXK9_9LACO|nr:HPr(Ser) kinase/phosphatase [Fructilactobacillus lindneri]ANZ58460.1 HPr kinase/phosphorylase [Fructilactobacillus lindneri]ANZ59770.1 HPr kinase/phosphorylase [Fructilactobacillus lindneri]KRN79290.1 HPr kinase phosphorylase [Fructilactobacillus lindneri DSM 20690 = JCM 11027]POG98436.1 HPr kinase/phosphorylase [Fructilactobacillus lindneri]POH03835.1 HPr kinase/phosphorylase [Fructilactobacillus lindneri]